MSAKYLIIHERLLISLFAFSLMLSCSDSEKKQLSDDTDERLELIGSYDLAVREPSGLTLTTDGEHLWTVSDEFNSLYKITKKGVIVDTVKVSGYDLEGIEILDNDHILVVTERDRGILLYDPDMVLKKRVLLDISGEENSGIEGIVYNPKTESIYIVNEKKPGMLVEVNDKFEIINRKDLKFAKDYSGLEIDTLRNQLWIISDENQVLVKCDLEGNPIDQYRVNIPQIEGIAIDFSNNLIYVVSDNTEKLYVFRLFES